MKQLILAGLVTLGLVTSAQAGMMTHMQTLTATDSFTFNGDGSGTVTMGSPFFSFPQFDMPGATLLSAFIEYEVISSSAEIKTTNLSTSETLVFEICREMNSSIPDFPPFGPGSAGGDGFVPVTLGPGEMIIDTNSLAGDDFTELITDPTDLANSYVGSGNVNSTPVRLSIDRLIRPLTPLADLTMDSDYYDEIMAFHDQVTAGTLSDDLSLLQTVGSLSVEVKATITYTYEDAPAVPEPSTFALLGIGGVALVGYGWRRKRRQAA